MRPDGIGAAGSGLVLRPERAAGGARVEVPDGLPDRLRSVAVDRLGRDELPLRTATVQHDEDQVNNTCLNYKPGNTKGGSIIVQLTSCLTGLESAV